MYRAPTPDPLRLHAMADFFDDPDFPDRPQHRDYWRLVNAVNYFDGEALEGGKDVDEIIGSMIDTASVTYMARQRALRLAQATGLPEGPAAGLWIDAFICGVKFQQDGGHQSTPDPPR